MATCDKESYTGTSGNISNLRSESALVRVTYGAPTLLFEDFRSVRHSYRHSGIPHLRQQKLLPTSCPIRYSIISLNIDAS
jgi:D-alanyl-D-alanine carboxypeptidase